MGLESSCLPFVGSVDGLRLCPVVTRKMIIWGERDCFENISVIGIPFIERGRTQNP